MEGIQYVTNEKGHRTAVLIDLQKHSDAWEDFYDGLIAKQRANEPRESLSSVKKRLRRLEKLNG